jgi:hypothetical protein
MEIDPGNCPAMALASHVRVQAREADIDVGWQPTTCRGAPRILSIRCGIKSSTSTTSMLCRRTLPAILREPRAWLGLCRSRDRFSAATQPRTLGLAGRQERHSRRREKGHEGQIAAPPRRGRLEPRRVESSEDAYHPTRHGRACRLSPPMALARYRQPGRPPDRGTTQASGQAVR